MENDIFFNYTINPGWDIVKQIREKVELSVSEKNEDLAYASKMTASELIENAVKYGCPVDNQEGIAFNLNMNNNQITIKVSNGVRYQTDYQKVIENIDKINDTDNHQELYIQRLSELMENDKPGQSQLGLYRIAFEGEFNLAYEYKDEVLTVTATRNI